MNSDSSQIEDHVTVSVIHDNSRMEVYDDVGKEPEVPYNNHVVDKSRMTFI